jgi:hypothetical protein
MLPINSQTGPRGSAGGIGDAIVMWGQSLVEQDDLQFDVQLGARLATGNANGEPTLPQWYQSGFGSNDILAGTSAKFGVFDAAIAGQFPLGRSSNVITRLKRGNDILLRGGYTYATGRLVIHPSLLLIKRFGESSIANPNPASGPAFINVPGSDQTQVNVLADASFRFSEAYSFNAGIAIPLLKREVNVDGLTRALTITTGLSLRF